MHLEHLNTFMERARNYNEVQPQTTHSKSSLHLAYSERACFLFSEEAMWHDRLIFHDILQKTCKAEVLFNLTYASGVIWRPVNYNHAWLVLKLSSMPLNGGKKKTCIFFTVKKQNIIREYVCCECSTTKDPFMCRIGVFLLRTVTQLRSTVDSVFILNTCSTAEHQPAAATNLKQLPHQKRHSSSTAASIKTGQRQKGTG